MKSKIRNIVGLDIGSSSLKCLEMAFSKGAPQIVRAAYSEIRSGDTAGALREITQAIPLASKVLRVSVSGPSVLIRRVKLPLMTREELAGAIRFEAESHIPFPVQDCVLDFQILSQEPAEMNVLLVAAKRDFIDERLEELKKSGIAQPELIDTDILCVVNAFDRLKGNAVAGTYGVLNIGHNLSSFAIVHQGEPFFIREMLFGGDAVTKEIASARSISEEEAEKLKKEHGASSAEEFKTATKTAFTSLVEQLEHSIDFFENEVGSRLPKIWVSGGGALSHASDEVLAAAIGREVSLWGEGMLPEITDASSAAAKEHFPQMAVSLGLCLRGT